MWRRARSRRRAPRWARSRSAGTCRSPFRGRRRTARGFSSGPPGPSPSPAASGFDFTLNLRPGATTDEMKTVILDQLGLQLTAIADGQQVEFLVAERLQ